MRFYKIFFFVQLVQKNNIFNTHTYNTYILRQYIKEVNHPQTLYIHNGTCKPSLISFFCPPSPIFLTKRHVT